MPTCDGHTAKFIVSIKLAYYFTVLPHASRSSRDPKLAQLDREYEQKRKFALEKIRDKRWGSNKFGAITYNYTTNRKPAPERLMILQGSITQREDRAECGQT